jgi:hypothetical protein
VEAGCWPCAASNALSISDDRPPLCGAPLPEDEPAPVDVDVIDEKSNGVDAD